MGSRETSYFFAVSSETMTTCRLLERLGVPSGRTIQPSDEGMACPLWIWSAHVPRRSSYRAYETGFRLARVWRSCVRRSPDDEQTNASRNHRLFFIRFFWRSFGWYQLPTVPLQNIFESLIGQLRLDGAWCNTCSCNRSNWMRIKFGP